MKFLVLGDGVDYGGPADPMMAATTLEMVIQPSLKMIDAWVKSGKAQGGLLAGQRSGALIMEAGSANEIGELLQSLPFWGIVKWTVTPIQDISSSLGAQDKIIANLKQAAKMMSPQH